MVFSTDIMTLYMHLVSIQQNKMSRTDVKMSLRNDIRDFGHGSPMITKYVIIGVPWGKYIRYMKRRVCRVAIAYSFINNQVI